jgi:hypothetical protein
MSEKPRRKKVKLVTAQITYDKGLSYYLGRCVVWLETLPGIQKKPDLVNHLKTFVPEENILKFKAWVHKTVTPHFNDTPQLTPEVLVKGILRDYGLLEIDFQKADLAKFIDYLHCFSDHADPPKTEV